MFIGNDKVAAGNKRGDILIWNLPAVGEKTPDPVRLAGHTNEINRLVITPDGKSLISASSDRTVKIWDTLSEKGEPGKVTRLGLPNIAKHEHGLLEYATEHLSRIDGLRLLGSAREKVAVVSFVLKDKRTEDVGRLLDLEGIAVRAGHHCAQPSLRRFGVESTVRPSFSIYNTTAEIDRLVEAIKRIQRV